MTFEFQSVLHPTRTAMLRAIAEEWITAGGANDAAFIASELAENTDSELAAECIIGWGLDQANPLSDSESHMDARGYDASDLEAAFADVRQERQYAEVSEAARLLATMTTRDEAGTHFTQRYSADELEALESEGLIEIERPVHEPTGIDYGQEEWRVRITDAGAEELARAGILDS